MVKIREETISWKDFKLSSGGTIWTAIIGMAVIGNEIQVIVANDIHVIHGIARIHGDRLSIDWINPPIKFRQEIEEKLIKYYVTSMLDKPKIW